VLTNCIHLIIAAVTGHLCDLGKVWKLSFSTLFQWKYEQQLSVFILGLSSIITAISELYKCRCNANLICFNDCWVIEYTTKINEIWYIVFNGKYTQIWQLNLCHRWPEITFSYFQFVEILLCYAVVTSKVKIITDGHRSDCEFYFPGHNGV
jgi:hypothetical protein